MCWKTKRLAIEICGARNQAVVTNEANKNPENNNCFRGVKSNQTRMSLGPSFIQTVTVGPGITPDHACVVTTYPQGAAQSRYYICSRAVPPIGNSLALCANVTLPRRLLFSWYDYNANQDIIARAVDRVVRCIETNDQSNPLAKDEIASWRRGATRNDMLLFQLRLYFLSRFLIVC